MSQVDYEVKEIDGYTYKVLMLDPLLATDLLTDLCQLLAPALGALGGVLVKERGDVLQKALDGFDADEKTNIDVAFERAVLGFFGRLDKAKQREWIAMLTKVTMLVLPDGKEPMLSPIFLKHFQGRVFAMYKWLAFALKVQYRDFFSGTDLGIGQIVQKAMAMYGSQSTSPNTPTSGD
jgi:hypothetical protein